MRPRTLPITTDARSMTMNGTGLRAGRADSPPACYRTTWVYAREAALDSWTSHHRHWVRLFPPSNGVLITILLKTALLRQAAIWIPAPRGCLTHAPKCCAYAHQWRAPALGADAFYRGAGVGTHELIEVSAVAGGTTEGGSRSRGFAVARWTSFAWRSPSPPADAAQAAWGRR